MRGSSSVMACSKATSPASGKAAISATTWSSGMPTWRMGCMVLPNDVSSAALAWGGRRQFLVLTRVGSGRHSFHRGYGHVKRLFDSRNRGRRELPDQIGQRAVPERRETHSPALQDRLSLPPPH